MTVHLLVEGPSDRAFLEPLAKKVLQGIQVRVHPHQGKGSLPTDVSAPPSRTRRGLLDQLPSKLRGFAQSRPRPAGVLILVDADDDDCAALAQEIARVATSQAPGLEVIVRIAIEESEAFFLGDLAALKRAYPQADMALARNYVPDSICGTWELLGTVIGDDGANKVAWAEKIGPCLSPSLARSRSPSFKALLRALTRLRAPTPSRAKKKRNYRHRAKPKL